MIYLGTDYGGWYIYDKLIDKNSIIYSAGIGTDISFDLELINRFNVIVHGFDPTPRSLAWIKTQSIPHHFIVHTYGVSNIDGTLLFLPPEKEEYVSYRENNFNKDGVLLPVKRISTIMKELNHDHIDIFKMDIEGSEYGVIDDMLQNKIYPKQLLIEFHNFKLSPVKYIDKLKQHFEWIGQKNKDFYFLKKI